MTRDEQSSAVVRDKKFREAVFSWDEDIMGNLFDALPTQIPGDLTTLVR